MLAHQTARRKSEHTVNSTRTSCSTPAIGPVSSSKCSSLAQAKGFARLSGLSVARQSASLSSLSSTLRSSASSSNTPSTSSRSSTPLSLTPIIPTLVGLPQPAPTLTDEEQAFQEEQTRQHDIRAVRNALYRYKDEPLEPDDNQLDLVQWWDVSGLAEPTC